MENTHITGWEIVPYIPTNDKDSNFVELDSVVHAQMFKILTDIVRMSSAQLNETSTNEGGTMKNEVIEAVPISYMLPEGFDDHSATMRIERFIAEKSWSQRSNNKTRNAASRATGEVLVSFELPDNFPANGIDIDKLALPEEKRRTSIAQKPRQYTFTQRLKGWKVKRSQRFDGRYDKSHYHFESKTQFRSAVEVAYFLLYEEYPKKQNSTPNKSTAPVEGSKKRKRPRSEKKTKKPPPVHPNSQSSGGNKPEETVPTTKANVSVDNPVMQYWQMQYRQMQYRQMQYWQKRRKFEENYHNNFLNNYYNFAHWSSNARPEINVELEERWRRAQNELRSSVSEMMTTPGADKRNRTENLDEEARRSTKIPKQTRSKRIAIPMEVDREGSQGQEVKSEPVVKNVNSGKAEKTNASSPSGDLLSFANVIAQVEIDDISLEAATVAENAVIHEHDHNLAVLSSVAEECDLINYLPIDDITDDAALPK